MVREIQAALDNLDDEGLTSKQRAKQRSEQRAEMKRQQQQRAALDKLDAKIEVARKEFEKGKEARAALRPRLGLSREASGADAEALQKKYRQRLQNVRDGLGVNTPEYAESKDIVDRLTHHTERAVERRRELLAEEEKRRKKAKVPVPAEPEPASARKPAGTRRRKAKAPERETTDTPAKK